MEELTKQVRELKVGKTFYVKSELKRQNVLRIAKILGVAIVTRRCAKGFSCTRIPE